MKTKISTIKTYENFVKGKFQNFILNKAFQIHEYVVKHNEFVIYNNYPEINIFTEIFSIFVEIHKNSISEELAIELNHYTFEFQPECGLGYEILIRNVNYSLQPIKIIRSND